MGTTEAAMEYNLDISKFLNLEKSSYIEMEKKYCNVTLLRMLKEGLGTDITINANGGSVKAHKSVLMSVSPVFEAMFTHNMQEQLTSTVDLSDISIQGLQLFLLLVYVLNDNTTAPLQFKNSINELFDELLETCCKYQVTRLGLTITDNLKFHLTPKNCWNYFNQCLEAFSPLDMEPSADPRVECWNYVLKHYRKVIESRESFISEMQTNPTHVYEFLTDVLTRLSTK